MLRIVSILTVLALSAAIGAYDRSIAINVGSTVFNCEESSCDVSFNVENLADNQLSLSYEGVLIQKYSHDPSKSGIVEVGHFVGEVMLSPHERRTISRNVDIDKPPNGSRISISAPAR